MGEDQRDPQRSGGVVLMTRIFYLYGCNICTPGCGIECEKIEGIRQKVPKYCPYDGSMIIWEDLGFIEKPRL